MTTPSPTTVQPAKMELTPQIVTWNGVDLGGTKGGVTIEIKFSKGEIKADQYGTTVLDRRLNGFEAKVSLELAEVRNLERLNTVFPNAVLTNDAGDLALDWKLPMGASDLDQAATLTLHPIVADSTDVSQDWTFVRAFPSEESSLKYGPEEQTTAKLVFNVYPLLSGSNEPYFMKMGDPSVGTQD